MEREGCKSVSEPVMDSMGVPRAGAEASASTGPAFAVNAIGLPQVWENMVCNAAQGRVLCTAAISGSVVVLLV